MGMKVKNNNMPSVGRFESTDDFLCIDFVYIAVKASKNLFLRRKRNIT